MITQDSFNIEKLKIEVTNFALMAEHGNKTRAARRLGMSIRTLRNWIRDEENLSVWRSAERLCYPEMISLRDADK
jgi:hypothetical protein